MLDIKAVIIDEFEKELIPLFSEAKKEGIPVV